MKIKIILLLTLLAFNACDSNDARAPLGCGGGIEFSCPIGLYCQMSEDCGGIDSKGYCAPIPKACPDEEDIVCGCDNREYKNKCIANTQSISQKNIGPCIVGTAIEVHK